MKIPTYRLHKPTNQAIVVLGGRTHYLGRHGTAESRKKYDELIMCWIANGRRPLLDAERLTVARLIVRYMDFAAGYYRKNGKPTGELRWLKECMKRVNRLFGTMPAADFRPTHLRMFQQHLIAEKHTKTGRAKLNRTSINGFSDRVRRMYRWAVSYELVSADVLHALQAVPNLRAGRSEARESRKISPVPEANLVAILPHLPDHVAAMAQTQYLTGMRPNEIRNMRPKDIDMSGPVWLYVPEHHKTEHHDIRRVIPIGPRAQAVLRPVLTANMHRPVFQPINRHGTRETRHAEHYDKDAYRIALQRACKLAGVPRFAPNQLRHGFATEARRQGFNVEAIRTVLGHTKPATTEIYAERDLNAAIAVARQIG